MEDGFQCISYELTTKIFLEAMNGIAHLNDNKNLKLVEVLTRGGLYAYWKHFALHKWAM